MKKANILVVGSINQDIIMTELIDQSVNDAVRIYGKYGFTNGGKGANQASALKMLGAETTLIGCVGDDEFGRMQLKGIEARGIKTDYIRVDKNLCTGLSIMVQNSNYSYKGFNVVGGNGNVTPELVEKALDAERFDMVIMQLEMPVETAYRTYELARDRGVKVIFDPAPSKNIPLNRFKGVYIITPNEDELCALTGVQVKSTNDARNAAEILYEKCTPEYVVLKLGGMGAYIYDGKNGKRIPAFKTSVVDTCGAGDSFTAGLVIRLMSGDDMGQAAYYANAAAAVCITRVGGQTSLPSKEEVDEFLKTAEPID